MSATLADYDYELPPDRIAQRPVPGREGSRLLLLDRDGGGIRDASFADLPALLAPGDLLVVNDTRVLPARFLGHHHPSGHEAEVLVHTPLADGRWEALVRPSKRFRDGDRFHTARGVTLCIEEATGTGSRRVALEKPTNWESAMNLSGFLPLPPYIERQADGDDDETYQTVFAREPGAVAAPTAGLHFGETTLTALEAKGVRRAALTLHVGVGTFQPVREEDPERHEMHAERFTLPAATRGAVDAARAAGRRVVAVGTTSVRALESPDDAAWASDEDLAGETRLFIRPPFAFRRVDALLTNFHLPRSTLLMLVAAFAGRERVLAAYAHAVAAGYRFYSYGDAMLVAAGVAP